MYLKVPYISYPSVLKPEICDKIIQHGKDKLISAIVVDSETKTSPDQTPRSSHVSWLTDQWIYDLILPYIKDANQQAGWNWKFDCIEPIQFTKYALDQFYDWHPDGGSDFLSVYSNQSDSTKNGKIRKISVTINLVDSNDYEGGSLEFDLGISGGIETCDKIKPKGSIVVFPSFIPHRVTSITKGIRYSLVMWVLGKPWQ